MGVPTAHCNVNLNREICLFGVCNVILPSRAKTMKQQFHDPLVTSIHIRTQPAWQAHGENRACNNLEEIWYFVAMRGMRKCYWLK
jgi:hypothetical protein